MRLKQSGFFFGILSIGLLIGCGSKDKELKSYGYAYFDVDGKIDPSRHGDYSSEVRYILIGDVTPTSAKIHLTTETPGSHRVMLVGSDKVIHGATIEASSLEGTETFRGELGCGGYTPDTLYEIYDANGKIGEFKTLPEKPGNVRLFFGSCMDYDSETSVVRDHPPTYDGQKRITNHLIWKNAIPQDRFDAAFIIGDRFYLPNYYEDYEGMTTPEFNALIDQHHEGMMSVPGVQDFLSRTPLYVTWDDHDFGPNNSAKDFTFKTDVLKFTNWSLPNPFPANYNASESYFKADFGDVDVFLLEGRMHRDCANRTFERNGKVYHGCGVDGIEGEDGIFHPDEMLQELYGKEQMDWLKESLKESDAPVKLIVGGNQFLSNIHKWEAWYHYAERQEFIDWLNQNPIPGIAFVGGDRHQGMIGVLREEGPYNLYELTSSGLGVNVYGPDKDTPESPYDSLGGSVIQHYGAVEYNKAAGTLTFELINTDGEIEAEHTVSIDELRKS